MGGEPSRGKLNCSVRNIDIIYICISNIYLHISLSRLRDIIGAVFLDDVDRQGKLEGDFHLTRIHLCHLPPPVGGDLSAICNFVTSRFSCQIKLFSFHLQNFQRHTQYFSRSMTVPLQLKMKANANACLEFWR